MNSNDWAATPDPDEERAAQLRLSLRRWLDANLTEEIREAGRQPFRPLHETILRGWNRRLADDRWAAVGWPEAYGGRDASVLEQLAYAEEMAGAEAPGPVNIIGVSNIAPAIIMVGTDAQKDRHVQALLRGDEIWSQGMSEPDAGSDLASLRTSAVADGEDFVINGQKTWNSLGHRADWCQLYVRTDLGAPKHRGISCFLLDMRLPGVEARPVRTIDGETPFAEVFLRDVRVPASCLLGPLHGGWRVAMTTLGFERAGVARLHLSLATKLSNLVDEARQRGYLGDPILTDRIARAYADIACMRWLTNRLLLGQAGGQPSPVLGSLAKLAWASCEHQLAETAVHLLGMGALSGRWADNLLTVRQASIAGGTSEINKNILSEQTLGLPREPTLDRA